jgi:hypothetical protein
MLPRICDHGRVNGYPKSRHGIANGANGGDWEKPSDAVSEGNEIESAVSVVDAKDEEMT